MKLPSLLQDSAGLPIDHVLLLLLLLLLISRVTDSTHRQLLPAVWAEGSQASQQRRWLWLVGAQHSPPPPPSSPPLSLHLATTDTNI